jgi:glycogen operon protein
VEKETDLLRFVREMISINMTSPYFQESHFLNSHHTTVRWHGTMPGEPDWGEDSRSLAFSLHNPAYEEEIYVVLNAYWEPLDFEFPPPSSPQSKGWYRLVDTGLPSPEDISSTPPDQPLNTSIYKVASRSVLVLQSKGAFTPLSVGQEMTYDRLVRDGISN